MEENTSLYQPAKSQPQPTKSWFKIALLSIAGLICTGGLVFAGYRLGQRETRLSYQAIPTLTLTPTRHIEIVVTPAATPIEIPSSPTSRPVPTSVPKPAITLTPKPTKIRVEKVEVTWFLDNYGSGYTSKAVNDKGIIVTNRHNLLTRIDVYGIGDAETKQIRYNLDDSNWIGLDVYNTDSGFFSLIWPESGPNSIKTNFGELSVGYHKIKIEVETKDGQIFSEEKTFYFENP